MKYFLMVSVMISSFACGSENNPDDSSVGIVGQEDHSLLSAAALLSQASSDVAFRPGQDFSGSVVVVWGEAAAAVSTERTLPEGVLHEAIVEMWKPAK